MSKILAGFVFLLLTTIWVVFIVSPIILTVVTGSVLFLFLYLIPVSYIVGNEILGRDY